MNLTTEQREALALVLAHYGDDPRVQPLRDLAQEPRDWCTDPDNCKRCKAPQWDQLNHSHAGIPVGSQRKVAQEPQADPMPGMSGVNRTIAYSAADKLRGLGFAWNGEAWVTQAEPGAWSEQDAVALAHRAGFAGTHWSMEPEELVHLLNMVAHPPQRKPLNDKQISNRLWEAD